MAAWAAMWLSAAVPAHQLGKRVDLGGERGALPTRFRGAHARPGPGRQKYAPAPAASSPSAGSSTLGSSASRALAPPYPGLQPSRYSRFSTLYRLASSAAPVSASEII